MEVAKTAGATHVLDVSSLDQIAFVVKIKHLSADKHGANLSLRDSVSLIALKSVTAALMSGN